MVCHENSCFCLPQQIFAHTKWKITVGGLAEVDIMNQAEPISDNSCLLSFVCLTYNLTIAW